mmetsp:Transcript_17328/g.32869  ORF Transcript_17328/g.32869 Transcript_17328/m.32869 type:complete len:255 (+) Transcript_17328:141-905(+)|eukprot:scaffold2353_cov167-Amphora_coffeaeformis.AAC.52
MGVATSRIEYEERRAPKELTAQEGGSIVVIKRKTRAPNLRMDDCFGLDESQSRSTESTQGSPEIDIYPSKASREARRTSFGSSMGVRPKWFRRQSSSKVRATNEDPALTEEPSHPPSYLVFQKDDKMATSNSTGVLKSSPSSSGRTAPVPVQSRKIQSVGQMDGCDSCSDLGDPDARMDELQRMYDLRTWNMYLRITEARKKNPTATTTMIPHHHERPAQLDDYDYFTPGDERVDEPDIVDVSKSEDMIFGDLE